MIKFLELMDAFLFFIGAIGLLVIVLSAGGFWSANKDDEN